MDYFLLLSKKDRGCPEVQSAILYDKFYVSKNAEKIDIGNYSWYKNLYPNDIPFQEKLFFIAKDKLWDFDIRRDSIRFSIVSEEFLALLKRFSAPIRSCVRVTVCSKIGKPISIRNYYAVAFTPVEIKDVADESSCYEIWEPRTVIRIDKLVIRNSFSEHFTMIAHAPCCPSICSEEFYKAAIEMGTKGIEFTPVKQFRWEEEFIPI